MSDILRQQDIDDLKAIWREEQHEELSDEGALEMGHRLMRAFDALTRPRASSPIYPNEVRPPSRLTSRSRTI